MKRGSHHSEETRRKLSEVKKGENHPLYGKHHSEETKRKMSESKKGGNHPMFGKHPSEETKKKLSETHKGEKHYLFGKHLSKETRRKMGEAKKGKHPSEKTKRKMSESKKGKYVGKNNHMFGKHLSEETRRKIGKASSNVSKETIKKMLKRNPMSSLEIKMNNILQTNNLPYKFVGNGEVIIGRKCPDFVNCNGEKTAIEVYYRKHKKLFRGDVEIWKKERSEIFAKYGWKLLFFDETQVNENTVLNILNI